MTSFVSVIVPVYNDPVGVAVTIESVLRQTYPRSAYELLVVDNGSTDDTGEVVRTYREQHPDLVTLHEESTVQSSYAARNVGIAEAKGSRFVFLDADMTVPPTYIEDVVATLAQSPHVGGRVRVYVPEGRVTYVARYNRLMVGDNERNVAEFGFVPTSSLSVRRAVVDAVGGFDPRLESSGDVLVGKRATAAGYEPLYDPSLTAYHPARTSLRDKFERDTRIGRGLSQRAHHHPQLFSTASFFNLSEYLPPRPTRVRKRLGAAAERKEVSISPVEWIVFYLLYYLQIVTRVTARRAEELRIRFNETTTHD
jgi:glycosyltransferase involved in cell wall biosynthesis